MTCDLCGKTIVVGSWPFCPHGYGAFTQGPDPGTHSSEKVVVYRSVKEGGKVQFPGRGDVPVPDRLVQRGYERVELNVRDLASFERQQGVSSERRHFNKGNGF